MSAHQSLRRQDLISRLREYLGDLSPESQQTLTRSIDRARARGETTPVHAMIMEAMRDVSGEVGRVERVPSAERAFFAPLEPIMRSLALPDKQTGIIDRASLRPIWIWITRDLAPGRCDGSLAALRAAIVDEDPDTIRDFAEEFQDAVCRQSVRYMEEMERTHKSLQRLESQLGSSRVMADLNDIIAFFNQRYELNAFIAQLPDKLPAGREGLDLLAEALKVYQDRPVSDAVYAFAAIKDRLGSTSDLVRFAVHASDSSHPAVLRGTHVGGAVQIAMSEAALEVENLRVMLAGERNLIQVTQTIKAYQELVTSIVRTLTEAPADPWHRRLSTIRTRASDLLTQELEPLLFMIKRTISVVENRGQEIVPDPSSVDEAVFGMTLLLVARETREALAINTLIERLEKGIEDALESQGKPAIDRLASASDENWEAACARSEAAVKLFGIYYGGTYGASMARRHSSMVEARQQKLAS